ncbi:MAG TPA: hypothetical protein VF123_14035 [Candidatus Sulfotelmatobacter sp.]
MEKTILGDRDESASPEGGQWFSIDCIAGIAVTSEAPDAPVESILDPNNHTGWRAGTTGTQLIRITFDAPKTIRRIQLAFGEQQLERTQEFTLNWSTGPGDNRTEIVRQQWTFSPQGSTSEFEDYRVNLKDVLIVELTINPDISHGPVHASLLSLRLG